MNGFFSSLFSNRNSSQSLLGQKAPPSRWFGRQQQQQPRQQQQQPPVASCQDVESKLNKEISDLKQENFEKTNKIAELEKKIIQCRGIIENNANLKRENAVLKEENIDLKNSEKGQLIAENQRLREGNGDLIKERDALINKNGPPTQSNFDFVPQWNQKGGGKNTKRRRTKTRQRRRRTRVKK
jgi:hypothetical protein